MLGRTGTQGVHADWVGRGRRCFSRTVDNGESDGGKNVGGGGGRFSFMNGGSAALDEDSTSSVHERKSSPVRYRLRWCREYTAIFTMSVVRLHASVQLRVGMDFAGTKASTDQMFFAGTKSSTICRRSYPTCSSPPFTINHRRPPPSHHRRHTEMTTVNDTSSRSHALCLVRLSNGGKLVLVDCAGTERKKDSMWHTKERQLEGAHINTSLHSLKECIRHKAESNSVPTHVYRASCLTKLLADAFQNNGLLSIFCTVSPCATDTEHSRSIFCTVSATDTEHSRQQSFK